MNTIERDILNNIKILYKISIRRNYNPMWVVNMLYKSYNTVILNDIILKVLANTIHYPKRTVRSYIHFKLVKQNEVADLEETEVNNLIFSNKPEYVRKRRYKHYNNKQIS